MDNKKLQTIRHSFSHILAATVLEMFPEARLGIGPAIENGFYYDFDLPRTLIPEDLAILEKKMRALIKKDIKFQKYPELAEKAKEFWKKAKQSYKAELVQDLMSESQKKVSFYQSGNFIDLCSGPHIQSTKELNPEAFKLTKIAGAYWRGDEKNKMLQRIYGLAFETEKELKEYIKQQEEAEKRDHRTLGKNLGLFIFSDIVGKGLPLYTEKGTTVRRELERLIVDEEIKRGYKHVCTPDLAKVDLYKQSGHYPYYKDTMYPVMKIDEEELILRPMACPHHYQLYLARPRSYRELPFRIAEIAKQYRYEKSGELTGLIRVRSFCLADAHIICQKENAKEEINKVLDLIDYMANVFGLKINIDYSYRLSLGDKKNTKKYYKDDKAWTFAEDVLKKVLKERSKTFSEAKDEAAFYGPKIDVQMKNFSGKEDTAFTVQYDFVGPKRFNLSYIDSSGKNKEAIVIHRSSIGAIERTMALLIEKYKGAFPTWLAPIQAVIIPISEKYTSYGREIYNRLKENGIRAEIDDSNESLSMRIRNAEMQKIPYILVAGEKELKNKEVAIRKRGEKKVNTKKLDKFIKELEDIIKERRGES